MDNAGARQVPGAAPGGHGPPTRALNKVLLIGFVGRRPEMRFTPAGRPVTTFNLMVPRAMATAEGGTHTAAEWFTVVAWGPVAEQCSAELGQDSHVYIEGALQTRAWTDAEGRRQQHVEVVAAEVVPLDGVPAAEPVHPTDPTTGAARPTQEG